MTDISNYEFPEVPQGVIDVLTENGYTLVRRLSPPEVDDFDPTDRGKKEVDIDDDFDDFDDIELGEPQVCTLQECESCQ